MVDCPHLKSNLLQPTDMCRIPNPVSAIRNVEPFQLVFIQLGIEPSVHGQFRGIILKAPIDNSVLDKMNPYICHIEQVSRFTKYVIWKEYIPTLCASKHTNQYFQIELLHFGLLSCLAKISRLHESTETLKLEKSRKRSPSIHEGQGDYVIPLQIRHCLLTWLLHWANVICSRAFWLEIYRLFHCSDIIQVRC